MPTSDVGCTDLCELLHARAAELGDRTAYVFLGTDLEAGQTLSYASLAWSAEAIARQLRAHAVPGDRVLLAFDNSLDAVKLFWGCIVAGVIPVPAPAPDKGNARVGGSRLVGICDDADVALAMTDDGHIESGRAQAPGRPWRTLNALLNEAQGPDAPTSASCSRDQDAVAYLQYTSGSTSAPRGVEITHHNVLAQCQALMSGVDTHGKTGLVWLPWFHDYGLVHGVLQPLYSAGTSFLMSTAQFLLHPLKWLEAIARHGVTHSGAPNFAYAACVQALARAPHWTARLDGWRYASCGAEPVRATTLDAFANAFARFGFNRTAFAPSYGLAEAVLAVTVKSAPTPLLQLTLDAQALERNEVRAAAREAAATRTLVGCGPVLPGFQLRIVDPDTGRPCASDRVGEIWVAGPSVARGYRGQADASTEHFGGTLAPGAADTARYLRTGDLGFIHGGELFVAGRRKDLIIANGRNLYPQDLEQTAEAAHLHIRVGGVIAVSVDKGVKETVVVLVECSRRPSPDVVRQLVDAVHQRVSTEHQVDVHDIVPLRTGTLPRTSSGKPQRSAARRLYLQGRLEPLRMSAHPPSSAALSPGQAPDDALLDTLALLWSDVLGREVIDHDASFFDLGGDSLLATQLVSRLRARLGLDLPISAVFEAPTVRGLADRLRQTPASPNGAPVPSSVEVAAPPPAARGPGSPVGLSFSQERMWFMHELAPHGSAYNIPLAMRLMGPLNVPALQGALARVVERHEILRTRFVKTADGVSGEVVVPPVATIQQVQLNSDGREPPEQRLRQHLAEVTCQPFVLDQCPLFRVQLVHMAGQDAVLLIVMHHIISDQWSFAELGQELGVHYSALVSGTEASLPELQVQYADYARWHRDWFETERRSSELAYWSRRLNGLEPLPLNNDLPRPLEQSFRGAALRFPLEGEHIAGLRALGAAHGASLSMVLIAALNVLLLRHTGKTDIGIGVPIANRHHLASENLIGTFVNTLVFRTDLDGDPDFRTVLSRVREVSLEAFAHQDMPFEVLVRELAARPDSSRQPLFNVLFNMVNTRARDCHFEGLDWSRLDFDRASTQFDLSFVVDVLYDRAFVIEYATDLFLPDTVQRMGEHLLQILRTAVQAPGVRVATIPLLGEAERDRLHRWSHGPVEALSARTVTEWVASGSRQASQRTALVSGDVRLTHQELDEASNRLARLLRQRGVARGSRVGVCLPRSHDLVVVLLAILKAGAAYVPLDPDYPRQRLVDQMQDAELALLVSHSSVVLEEDQTPRLLVDGDLGQIDATAHRLQDDPLRDARPEDPAYLIYTSGSTGRPKGVAVPHRAVVNLLESMARAPGCAAHDRLLAVTTPSFDIAVLELFLPLGTGGTVVVASQADATDGRALAELMVREDITVLQATPSRWHLLLEAGWAGNPRLKALVGGEPLTPDLASRLLARCGEVWNMYGPTETTVWSSCWRVSPDAIQAIDLGRPVLNTVIQVLDPHLQPCPIGVPGEICIGGTGVAIGYHRQAALTAERFIEQPEARDPLASRIYRTGDRGRWRCDGSLEHGGRLDDQIKLRGFRVELGEIEARLLGHSAVARAVVVLREDAPGQPRLVAYVVPRGPMPPREELREHLRRWLPDHMVPGLFMALDHIPVLPNGKTNRRALPAPSADPSHGRTPPTPPRSPTETVILSIWQAALQSEMIGVHDNFFDLGGHSILAVGVVSRIESALQRPVALALLFKHPTVADLADALSQAQPDDHKDVPVAVLQPQGRGPGLFLLAGAEMYRRLAQQLDAEMPVYGVFSQTEIDLLEQPADLPPPVVTVETLAREYEALIRGIQPHGPYFLGGFSIGGLLAFEVARQLQAEGETIGLIALLDSKLPGQGFRHLMAGVARRLRLLRRQGLGHLLHIYRVYRHQAEHRHEPGSRRIHTYAQAIRAHEAVPCDLPAVFLQAGDDPSTAPAYGWRALVPGLAVERVPGKHMDILEPPHVDVLASVMRQHIARARGSGTLPVLTGHTAAPHPTSASTTS
ncbi:non-ribosomal peptide synthetase [Hydrogenophaga pseudoflava]|uniref:non-ribosomal peptide synthetase n=1 Tax=Hydrogenophaga pseudoflava TaxID=47421 RepID=UPI0027E4CA4C|nr:non-ribosomal peptide synthetase [Hydrogenophaga pseudoflava]MDQ7746424.1 amino acid adenylation domain-containing protein [Hydrogenophaga pseudoflava]